MRIMDCQNLRREIDETAPGELLSAFASRHLGICPECSRFSEEQRKLQDILSSLGTIEAPGDFDFRLRARLAGEKAGNAHFPLSLTNLSFGLRATVVATLLVVFGAVAFFNLKPASNNALVSNKATQSTNIVDERAHQAGNTGTESQQVGAVDATSVGAGNEDKVVQKRRVSPKLSLASSRNTPRMGTREMGSTPAKTIKASELNARAADFPIEVSSQPMKVSLDNGRGSSRTISLPPVSFGSQRVLSQGTTPLIASARSW